MENLNKFLKGVLTLTLIFMTIVNSHGQIVYNFNLDPYVSPSSIVDHVAASQITLSAGSVQTNQTTGTYFVDEPYISGTSGWAQVTQATAKRFCVTLTPDAGYSFSINSLSYDAFATGAGPSATGYSIGSTYYFGANVPDGGSVITPINGTITNQNGLAVATDVCIEGWDNNSRSPAPSGTGTFRIDNFVIGISNVLDVTINKYLIETFKNKLVVAWSTLSETNDSHFTIEHSTDGKKWSELGRVEAQLNRSNEKDYSFEHKDPAHGINYYRLNQFDLDGTKTTFDVLAGFFKGSEETFLFPTIAPDAVYISGETKGRLQVIDAQGRVIQQMNYQSGNPIPTTNLSSGQYFLKLEDQTFTFFKP